VDTGRGKSGDRDAVNCGEIAPHSPCLLAGWWPIGLWLSVLLLLTAAVLPLAGGACPGRRATRAWLTVIENLRLPIGAVAVIAAVASLVLRRGRLCGRGLFLHRALRSAGRRQHPGAAAGRCGDAELEGRRLQCLGSQSAVRSDSQLSARRETRHRLSRRDEEEHKAIFATLADLYPTQVTCHQSTNACETMLLSRFPARIATRGADLPAPCRRPPSPCSISAAEA